METSRWDFVVKQIVSDKALLPALLVPTRLVDMRETIQKPRCEDIHMTEHLAS
jgi:hypothetical protein